jgi:hypothetical protein
MDCSFGRGRAFFTIGDVEDIASPAFARRVRIAQEMGLLEKLLLDDRDAVSKWASELKTHVFAQIPARPRYENTSVESLDQFRRRSREGGTP